MAFDFSSMARTLEKGSKLVFLNRFKALIDDLLEVVEEDSFYRLHDEFCEWGSCTIRRSSPLNKPYASYGQIAKTLNVSLKAVVYYCGLPTARQAKKIIPWLHPRIHNKMMRYLEVEP